jgi:hypothetical protein
MYAYRCLDERPVGGFGDDDDVESVAHEMYLRGLSGYMMA